MDKPTADEKAGRARRIRRLVVCIAICLAVVLVIYLLRESSVKKQLAAIEAARAIPDKENAAVLYSQAALSKQHLDTWTYGRCFSIFYI